MVVGLASRWNRSTVLRGHVEDLMRAAEAALEARMVAVTGIGMRFATGDDWLASRLTDPTFVKRVLLAQTVDEYHELVRLMEVDDSVWVQVAEDD